MKKAFLMALSLVLACTLLSACELRRGVEYKNTAPAATTAAPQTPPPTPNPTPTPVPTPTLMPTPTPEPVHALIFDLPEGFTQPSMQTQQDVDVYFVVHALAAPDEAYGVSVITGFRKSDGRVENWPMRKIFDTFFHGLPDSDLEKLVEDAALGQKFDMRAVTATIPAGNSTFFVVLLLDEYTIHLFQATVVTDVLPHAQPAIESMIATLRFE